MIMQEFEPRRRNTQKSIETISNHLVSFSTSTFTEETLTVKRRTPFPYLKRKSIRVDLVLKQQKLAQKKKNEKKLLETLGNEKKLLESENFVLKGRIMQMEYLIQQFKHISPKKSNKISVKSQSCQTINKSKESNTKKNSITQCTKCLMHLSTEHAKYHSRICGNTQLNRLLTEKDLKTLQSIRKNQRNLVSKPKNNWRMKREEFLRQIKLAQKKGSSNCLIFYRPNFRKNVNQ